MKLEFLFTPTSDLKASLVLYRDGLGFTEVWREGDATVALALPGTEVQLMLAAQTPTPGRTAVLVDIEAFQAGRPERARRGRRALGDSRWLSGHLPGPGRGDHLRHGPVDGPETLHKE